MKLILKVCCALTAVVALSFVFDVTTGCHYTPPTGSIEPVDHNTYVCACSCNPKQRSRSLRVGVDANGQIHPEDDAEQQLPSQNNGILLDSADLDFLKDRYVGLRFRDVAIPQGSNILDARVQFTSAPTSTSGMLTVQIAAEAVDNAGPFSTTAGSLGTLYSTAATTAKVNWSPPDWPTAGVAGSAQLTANFEAVLDEVVNRSGWVPGNALVLLFKGTTGAALRKAFSQDGNAGAAALLTVDYVEPAPSVVGPQELPVCLPPSLVPNPSEADLAGDCENRVEQTLSGLAAACNYPSDCQCGMQTGAMSYSESLLWADKCDMPCVEDQVDPTDCGNFDPVNGFATATNAAGDQPVCAAYSPLAAEVFGRRSMCAVDGTAHVDVGGHSADPHAAGIVQFVGATCPGGGCAVGMQYNLDIANVTFGNFFHSETFSDLGGIGETSAGNEAMLSTAGDGSFTPGAAAIAAQGRRGSQLKGVATINGDPVNVNVGFGAATPMCSMQGTVIGSVDPEAKRCAGGPDDGMPCDDDDGCADDSSCTDSACNCVVIGDQDLSLSLDVAGDLLNQPPTANAGPDQIVECATAAVTNVVLDASNSDDPDSNIALYSWLRGGRAGTEVGFDAVSRVEQSLGAQSYILRVIDALGQADEDITEVNVADRIPPVVSCSVVKPVLSQTNHDMVTVGLAADAVDQCEGVLPVTVKVFADEDDDENTGDGKHSPDAKDIAVGTLRLRGERKGNSNGRVYLIIPEATDSSQNRGFSCCTVSVPLSNAPLSLMAVHNQAAAARAFCVANNGTAPAGYFVVGDGPVLGPKQ
jgi:hypothetical protein